MMLRKNILLVFLAAATFACTDGNAPQLFEGEGIMENAPQFYEDCGWVINVGGDYLKANSLPFQYEVDDLEVLFTYEDLNIEESCQAAGVQLKRIRLVQIAPR